MKYMFSDEIPSLNFWDIYNNIYWNFIYKSRNTVNSYIGSYFPDCVSPCVTWVNRSLIKSARDRVAGLAEAGDALNGYWLMKK